MTKESIGYYRDPGVLTTFHGANESLFEGLPKTPTELCQVVGGLILHEAWAEQYGVTLVDQRVQEVRTRSADEMLGAILAMRNSSLTERREPAERMVGNCRHFSVLSTALLRRAGIPARARCGFGTYFETDRYIDHWVTEYWSEEHERWRRVDTQLDDFQCSELNIAFDTTDLPSGTFLSAGEAWQRYREQGLDASTFGIFDFWGAWFIRGNMVRDLASLNKVELLPWDDWGMASGEDDPAADELPFLDSLSHSLVSGDSEELRRLYDSDERLRVPNKVFDARFQTEVEIPRREREPS